MAVGGDEPVAGYDGVDGWDGCGILLVGLVVDQGDPRAFWLDDRLRAELRDPGRQLMRVGCEPERHGSLIVTGEYLVGTSDQVAERLRDPVGRNGGNSHNENRSKTATAEVGPPPKNASAE